MIKQPFYKFLLTIFFSMSVVAVSLGAYFWMFSRIGAFEVAAEEIRAKILFLEEERKAVRGVAELLKERESDILRISNFFVDPERVVEFIESMETLARDTGNKISIDFDEAKSSGENYFFRFTVDGTEEGVTRHLRALELYPVEIKIQEFSFQKLTGIDKESGHRVVVNVAVRKLTSAP